MKQAVLFFSMLTLIVLSSCEKVIDIDLNSEDPKVVIEAYFYEGDSTHTVTITKTLNFDETQAFPQVNNATVTISDNLGNTAAFISNGDGTYTLNNFPGIGGRTYTLTVLVDGKTYTAQSVMAQPVIMDDLLVDLIPFGQDTFKTVVPVFQDPGGIANYYSYHVFQNGIRRGDINLQDDQFIDGNISLQPLFLSELNLGDTIRVDMFGIDKPIWQYFNQLEVNTTSGTTPANPVSNFSGGCMGFFSARTINSKTIVYQ